MPPSQTLSPVAEGVDVEAHAGALIEVAPLPGLGMAKSSSKVSLSSRSSPATIATLTAGGARDLGVVGRVVAPAQLRCAARIAGEAKGLRGLDADDGVSRSTVSPSAPSPAARLSTTGRTGHRARRRGRARRAAGRSPRPAGTGRAASWISTRRMRRRRAIASSPATDRLLPRRAAGDGRGRGRSRPIAAA